MDSLRVPSQNAGSLETPRTTKLTILKFTPSAILITFANLQMLWLKKFSKCYDHGGNLKNLLGEGFGVRNVFLRPA